MSKKEQKNSNESNEIGIKNVLTQFKNDIISSINNQNININNRIDKIESDIKKLKSDINKIHNPQNKNWLNKNINQERINLAKSQNINSSLLSNKNMINANNTSNKNILSKNGFINEIEENNSNENDSEISIDNISENEEDNDKKHSISQSAIINNKTDLDIKNKRKNKKISKNKKRGKYRKKEEKSDFEKNIQYIEYTELKDGIKYKWKFSLSKYNKNTNTGYYYCSDTSCNGTGYYIFKLNKDNTLFEMIKEEEFNLKTLHTLAYEDHTYVIDKSLESDYKNLNKTEIIKKLSNHKYLKKFIRYYLNIHEEIGTSYIKLLELFTKDFGNINIDFDLIDEKDKTIMINILIKIMILLIFYFNNLL